MTEPVIYIRGESSLPINATVRSVRHLDQTISDFIVDTEQIDFMVRSIDLVIDDIQITPQEGDVIQYDNGSGAILYPLKRDENEQVFRRVNEFGGDLVIHTKRKGAPAA